MLDIYAQWVYNSGTTKGIPRERRKAKQMTTYQRDYHEALNGNGTEVLKRRKAEIDKLTAEGKSCKNGFRRTCIAQEVVRLQREYNAISELI